MRDGDTDDVRRVLYDEQEGMAWLGELGIPEEHRKAFFGILQGIQVISRIDWWREAKSDNSWDKEQDVWRRNDVRKNHIWWLDKAYIRNVIFRFWF